MKHKTWFRLVIKAIGVLLIGVSLPEAYTSLLQIGYAVTEQGAIMTAPYPTWWTICAPLAPFVQFAFGVYLLCGAPWLVNKVIPSNRPYCPECGYDLTRFSGDRCPECGVAVASGPGAAA